MHKKRQSLLTPLLLTVVASGSLAAGATISNNNAAAYNAAVSGLQSHTVDFTNVAFDDQNMSGTPKTAQPSPAPAITSMALSAAEALSTGRRTLARFASLCPLAPSVGRLVGPAMLHSTGKSAARVGDGGRNIVATAKNGQAISGFRRRAMAPLRGSSSLLPQLALLKMKWLYFNRLPCLYAI